MWPSQDPVIYDPLIFGSKLAFACGLKVAPGPPGAWRPLTALWGLATACLVPLVRIGRPNRWNSRSPIPAVAQVKANTARAQEPETEDSKIAPERAM